MGEYSEECLRTFLKDQGQLFDEPVAETLEEQRSISGRLHGSCCGFTGGGTRVF